MSSRSSVEGPTDPTAEQVADFVSAQVGPSAPADSGEREFVQRLASFRRLRRNRKRFAVGVTIATTLVVGGLVGSRHRGEAPAVPVLSYRVDNQEPPSSGYILVPQTAESLLAFSDGSKVRMAPRARGRVVEVNSRGARFALDDGKVSVDVVQRPRAQWIFEAGPFRVNVHGTSFTVVWNPLEAIFEVRLVSGAISVVSPVAGPEIQMHAGQSLKVSLRDREITMGTTSARESPPATDGALASTSIRAAADGARRASRNHALVAPRLDGRSFGKQGGRYRRRRRSPRTDGGARTRRQRRPLGAGQRRQICELGIRWRAKP